MQVVINISEKDYQTLKKKEEFNAMYLNYYEKLIVYGTPLPKGHGDLIDRKELLKLPIDKANYPSSYVKFAHAIIEADREDNNGNNKI
jgi:hypothetical protein